MSRKEIAYFFTIFIFMINCSDDSLINYNSSNSPLCIGLIGYWPLTGNVMDFSGNGNHGIVIGAVLTEDRFGRPNHAFYFDGIDDYIDVGNDRSLEPDLPISFSLWVYMDSIKSNILSTNFNDTHYYGIWAGINVDDRLNINFGDGGIISSDSRRSKYILAPEQDQWFHLVGIIRNDTDMDIYINTVNMGGEYTGNGGNIAYDNNSANIGRADTNYGAPPRYFRGKLDDIRIYNRELTPQEINNLFNSYN